MAIDAEVACRMLRGGAKVMMKLTFVFGIIIVVLIAAAPAAQCESFGFVRVKVLSYNAQHGTRSQLYSNSTALGIGFAHNDSGFGWTQLSIAHLNANSDSTPIYASYGNLSALGCEFDFEVFFSLDGVGDGISLGRYHAPSNPNTGFIPLGLKCDGETGALCSSNPRIREALRQAVVKQRIEAYNAFKRDYDNRIRREKELRDREAAAAADALADKTKRGLKVENKVAETYLAEKVAVWQKEFDAMVAASRNEAGNPVENDLAGSDIGQKIVPAITQDSKANVETRAAAADAQAVARSVGLSEAAAKGIAFSGPERELIAQIKQRQKDAWVTAAELKGVPFFQILTSINPTAPARVAPKLADIMSRYMDLSTTVYFNDWDRIPDALKGLNTTKNCVQVNEMII
jgi:hypothetical protein